jgi:hypothetical protein
VPGTRHTGTMMDTFSTRARRSAARTTKLDHIKGSLILLEKVKIHPQISAGCGWIWVVPAGSDGGSISPLRCSDFGRSPSSRRPRAATGRGDLRAPPRPAPANLNRQHIQRTQDIRRRPHPSGCRGRSACASQAQVEVHAPAAMFSACRHGPACAEHAVPPVRGRSSPSPPPCPW